MVCICMLMAYLLLWLRSKYRNLDLCQGVVVRGWVAGGVGGWGGGGGGGGGVGGGGWGGGGGGGGVGGVGGHR